MKKVILYPGRFQPMLPHHADVYKHLVAKFPDADVYVATSNKVEAPKSPFDAKEKSAIMTQLHDIPADKILIVRSPYSAREYESVFDMENTVAIFAVGGKDMESDPRFSFKPKKDGTPGYLQSINSIKDGEMPMSQRGYVYSAPTVSSGDEAASASAFRQSLADAPDIEAAKKIFTDTFGTFDENVFELVYDKITGIKMKESIDILRKLAGISEAPVEFEPFDRKKSPNKQPLAYEPKISKKDAADAAGRPDAAAASDASKVSFTDNSPGAMLGDKGAPINSKGRFMSLANMVPPGEDPNDPEVKKELFMKALAKAPGTLLGEINARLGTDDNSLAASDRLSNIIQDLPANGVAGLPDEDRKWTLTLVAKALKNMDLNRAGKGDQDEFGKEEEPESDMMDSLDLSELAGKEDFAEAEVCAQCGSPDCTCEPGACDCEPVEEKIQDHVCPECDGSGCEACDGVGGDISEGAGDLNELLGRFERECVEDYRYYGDVDAAKVQQHLDRGDMEGAAEEMAGSMTDQDGGSDNFDAIYDVAKDMIDDHMHTDEQVEQAVSETAENAMSAAMAELRKLAGL